MPLMDTEVDDLGAVAHPDALDMRITQIRGGGLLVEDQSVEAHRMQGLSSSTIRLRWGRSRNGIGSGSRRR